MTDLQSPMTTEPENTRATTASLKPSLLFTQQLLFKDVAPESIQDVLTRCVECHLAPNDILLSPGVVNEHLYLILTGKVSVHLEALDDPALTTLGAGECVGELSVFDGMPPCAYVKAVEPTRLLVIPCEILWELIHVSPVIARNLLYKLARRMRSSNATLSDTLHVKDLFEQAANHDALTGLSNRRGLEVIFSSLNSPGRQAYLPLSIAVIDIDHFKRFNDNYGHQAGDAVLATLGKHFQQTVRANDIVARYGGEEFLLVLPNTALQHAITVVDRLRQTVERQRMPFEGQELPQVTFSAGLSEWSEGETIDQVIEAADAALYRAKEAGRNQVCS